ncbi:hypothetical protein JL49_24425 [Pseudoalteromonas luteoviolacea]|nr:hypothetical protein JL49_24425 [Pseudoalteromonas luteoviolacea]
MSDLIKVNKDEWPEADYIPLVHINLEPSYFVENLGIEFFTECDGLAECENSLLKLERDGDDIYFALFKYSNIESGVNLLLDDRVSNEKSVVDEVLISLGVDSKYIMVKQD